VLAVIGIEPGTFQLQGELPTNEALCKTLLKNGVYSGISGADAVSILTM